MKPLAWSLTDVGRKRDHNEDSLLSDPGLALFAVADGMGGHQGGDHASRLAVDVLRREIVANRDYEAAARELVLRDPLAAVLPKGAPAEQPGRGAPQVTRWTGGRSTDVAFDDDEVYEELGDMPTDPTLLLVPPPAATILRSAARSAGRAIFDAAQDDSRLAGMGTTLTAILLDRDRAAFVHVGDSRAFLIRDGKVTQLTEDHSWIAEQVRAGILTESEARESKFRHIITRSVGFEREVDVDLFGMPIVCGDCFVLCSDGLSNLVTPDEIGALVVANWYGRVPRLLVELANERGGDDNISVVLICIANGAA
jgi:protein phosphatase